MNFSPPQKSVAMRLTLRTLLAFIDDILDPDDHGQLSHKIETSDFATELIHRSRDTVRRLRLGAPELRDPEDVMEGSGWVDPNTVSEYLDNTLAAENVAEYERVCLESDLNLAEVASCHHILTMVLGEPAEVDEKVRKRLYELPERDATGNHQLRIEKSHRNAEQPENSPLQEGIPPLAASAKTGQSAEAEKGVPDYLKEAARSGRRTRLWLLSTAALVCVIGYFAWDAWTPPKLPGELAGTDPELLIPEVEIGGLNEPTSENATETDKQGGASSPAGSKQDGQARELSMEAEVGVAEPSQSAGAVPAPRWKSDQEAKTSTKATMPPAAGSSSSGTEEVAVKPVLPAPDGEPEEPAKKPAMGEHENRNDAMDTRPETAAALEKLAAVGAKPDSRQPHPPADPSSLHTPSTAGSVPMTEDGGNPAPLPTPGGNETPTVGEGGDTVKPSEIASELPDRKTKEENPIQLGNYLGSNDVLLRFDPKQNSWLRMPPRSNLFTGERLLTLPKFRTQVVLAGLNLSLSGGTQIDLPQDILLGNDGGAAIEENFDSLPLEIVYGRMLLNASLNGSNVIMKVGNLVCWIQMEGSAGMAVEVNRQFVPGHDTEENPAPIVATWYLTSGTLQWSTIEGNNPGPKQTIQAPATWSFVDGVIGMPQLLDELPAWIDREPVTPTERRALTVLDDELVPGEPIGLQLLELNDRRQREVRTLAAQCSLYVGEFEPFVKALNDAQQKASWKILIDMLRQAMVLGPEVASQLRDAFVMLRGEEAAEDLMQMVRGYDRAAIGSTPESIKNGAISKLIGWLDHDSLDYRVLASFNLREITGKSIGYRPEYNAKQRMRGIRTWRKRLESGELLPTP